MNKIKAFFKNKENLILFFLSIGLTANSLFFIVSKIQKFSYVYTKKFPFFVFFAYFVLSFLVLGTIAFFSQKFNFARTAKKIAWVYFLTEITILYGIENIYCPAKNSTCLMLNNILPFAAVIYFILLGYLLVECRKKQILDNSIKFKNWIKNQGWMAISVVFFVFILNLGFGSYHLAQKAVVDEALWTFDRVPKFWNNVQDGEWNKTHISDKPGITVALISGIGLNWVNPKEFKNITWPKIIDNSKKTVLDMNFILRFPILFFSSLMLFVFYFFIEKLLNKTTAIFSIIFLGLSPILLGISTIINPDSLLWIFLPLSMLSFFIYQKENRNVYLYWAGILLGLALLTKYIANILYVFFFILIFMEYVFNKEKYTDSIPAYLKKTLIDYLTLVFFSLLTFLVFLPAAWVEISILLQDTLFSKAFQKVWPLFILIIIFIIADINIAKGKLISFLLNSFSKCKNLLSVSVYSAFVIFIAIIFANTYSEMKWIDFESILGSPKSAYLSTEMIGLFLANFYSLIFGISPLALLALIFLTASNIRRRISIGLEEKIGAYFIFFIIFYYLASTVNNVSATVRYQIVIYPIAFILAAMGVSRFLNIKKIKKYVPEYLMIVFLLFFSIHSLNFIKPYYLAYANDLLPQKYVLNLKDMGDGSYEAAQYLNALPDAENLSIWTDKNGVCTFFVGTKCTNDSGLRKEKPHIDYFVISAGRENRTSKMTIYRISEENKDLLRLDKLYENDNPEWELKIGKRPNNFVRIIKMENSGI